MIDHEAAETASRLAIAVMCDMLDRAGGSRLSPPLSPDEELALRTCFISDIAATIADIGRRKAVDGVAAYAPAFAEGEARKLVPPDFALLQQRGETRGERYAAVIDDLLEAGYAGVCIIDAGSPTLPASVIEDAVTALRQPDERIVIGPALNGDCTLIGVQRPCPELFELISSQAPRSLARTIARAGALPSPVEGLAPWYRVADGLALIWLMRELLGDGISPLTGIRSGAPARRTRAYLATLGERGDGAPIDPGLYELA